MNHAAAHSARGQPSALDLRVLNEQVALVYASMRSAAWTDPLVATLFASILAWQTGEIAIFGWLLLIYYHWSRAPALLRYFKESRREERALRWRTAYHRGILLNGITWGLAPLLFLPGELPLIALTMLFLMGLCMSLVIMVAPLPGAAARYLLPQNLCLAAALVLRPTGVNLALAAATLLFLGTMLHFAKVQSALLETALRARFDNESLAARLAAQVHATEEASQHKTRFLATASHDLRQPLHAIALLGAALELRLQGHPERANAERLMRAVRALSHTLTSMLDISRLDADVVRPEPQSVALQEIFQSINQTFVDAASERDLSLHVRASDLHVHSDPQLLRRLLSNLVDNAIKYTRTGGVLLVARRHARGGDAPEVWVEVYDTGIGIPPDQQPRVYEEFYQLGNPGRDRSLGLGIGLSIVARLARLLGHPLELHSIPGRGSRFRVRLPEATPTAQAHAPTLAPPPAALPERILVLDDEADIRHAMLVLLQAHGIPGAAAASDEAEAATLLTNAQAQGTPFTTLICDFRLAGGVDGLRVGQALARRFAPLALLLITGETAPERLQRVHAAGVPVLFKPVNSERLLSTLAHAAH